MRKNRDNTLSHARRCCWVDAWMNDIDHFTVSWQVYSSEWQRWAQRACGEVLRTRLMAHLERCMTYVLTALLLLRCHCHSNFFAPWWTWSLKLQKTHSPHVGAQRRWASRHTIFFSFIAAVLLSLRAGIPYRCCMLKRMRGNTTAKGRSAHELLVPRSLFPCILHDSCMHFDVALSAHKALSGCLWPNVM